MTRAAAEAAMDVGPAGRSDKNSPVLNSLPVLWNDDPRLRPILPAELRAETIGTRTLDAFLGDVGQRALLLTCAQGIADELARQKEQTLEEGARDILAQADVFFHHRNSPERSRTSRPCGDQVIDGLLRRHGLTGAAPVTLDEMGQTIGRTRERARQIQRQHQEALRSTWPSWPQLDEALELLHALAPCTETEFADQLVQHGLTSTRYSLASLMACASFTNRPFDLPVVDGAVGVTNDELSATRRAIRKLAARQGLASILQISDELITDGSVLSESDIRQQLAMTSNVVWLDPEHVTWADIARNRLVNTLRNLLSVHQPVLLSVAQAAVTDFWAFRNAGRRLEQKDLAAPSVEALRAFCDWHADFAVDSTGGADSIIATVELDYTAELGLEAAMLVELIRSTPERAADRTALVEAAEAVGMSAATVSLYLSYHPAFVAAAHNVWTTLGTDVPADVIATIQEHARRRTRGEAREIRTGSDVEGQAWVSFTVTSNHRISGVLTQRWLPPGSASTRLALTDERGDPCGTVVYNAETGLTHGLGIYMRRFNVQVGHCILIVADLTWDTAQIVGGDQSLLQGPFTKNRPI